MSADHALVFLFSVVCLGQLADEAASLSVRNDRARVEADNDSPIRLGVGMPAASTGVPRMRLQVLLASEHAARDRAAEIGPLRMGQLEGNCAVAALRVLGSHEEVMSFLVVRPSTGVAAPAGGRCEFPVDDRGSPRHRKRVPQSGNRRLSTAIATRFATSGVIPGR
jgi:hypothetical protein